MTIKFYNCPEPQAFDSALLPAEHLSFLDYEPNWALMLQITKLFEKQKNVLVIGHGGSITSFQAFYHGLIESATKVAWELNTVDPDYINWLKTQLHPSDTVVIAVSKSGETVTQLEALMHFLEFPMIIVAEPGTPLWEIGERLTDESIHSGSGVEQVLVEHPVIGGRFTGFTEVALLPAAVCGLDVRAIFDAGRNLHKNFDQDNEAFHVASMLWQLEQKGYVDVFMPIYDYYLEMSKKLIVQLCHESFAKDGLGQTYFATLAPESQHHTNQRFFGGPKNIIGYFIGVDNPRVHLDTTVPQDLADIKLKENTLGVLSGIPLDRSMHFEREATIEDAVAQKIPIVEHVLHQRHNESIGKFVAFWQLFAIYSALLRGVNPFDQPQVENSKKISFEKRLAYKK